MKDQIQFETNGLTVLAVNIAPDATDFKILQEHDGHCRKGDLVYKTDMNVWGQGNAVLPEGHWKYHCTTSDMTEEQAKVLVERCDDGLFIQGDAYTNYEDDDTFFNSALESIPGLLRSHGIDPNEKRVLLIKER